MSVTMLRKKNYFIQFSFKNRALNYRGVFLAQPVIATTRNPHGFYQSVRF